jgi:hypothetical protein
LTQDAFSRRDAQPCGRAGPSRVHLTFTRAWPAHPFDRRGQTHHRQDGNCLDALPCLPLACLAAYPSEPEKMCLASLCNRSTTRAPTDRSIPGRTAYAELTAHRTDTCSERPRGVLHPCGNRTPGGHAIDGAFPTLAKPTTTLPERGRPSTAPGDATSPRRFQPRARLFDLASDTSCPTHRIRRPSPAGSKSPSFYSRVNESNFPDPKCLPSTSAPEGTRHRARGLATGEPASSALSFRECLRTSKLDHSRIRGFFTSGRDGHALLVNFCNRNDPRPQPLERTNPARCVSGVTLPHCAA